MKINSGPVSGASFVDGGLNPNTTYYYQMRAIDGSYQESAPTTSIPGTTASQPVACDPYFSDNVMHVFWSRAYPDLTGEIRALGSNDKMGSYSRNVFRHLVKDAPFSYSLRYCP